MKPTLIIVDDVKTVRDVLRKHLEKDFELAGEAASGQEAIQLTARVKPRLVLMDLVMPGMSGIEAMREILQSVQPAPKVVIMSGLNNESVVMQALAQGACDYLPKPLDPRTLTKVLMGFAEIDAAA